MFARLSPFFPAMVVFLGAMVVAAGGFWASLRQSNFNSELRTKNEEIARLQRENASAITGGDGFASVGFSVVGADGNMVNANTMPDDLLLVPVIINHGRYPLYDLSVRFGRVGRGVPFDVNSAMRTYPIGNIAPGLATMTAIRIPHHGKDIEYNIFFSARNGLWMQFLRMPWMGNGWGRASKVVRNAEVLQREVSDNFPRQADGSIDWGEAGAQDKAPDAPTAAQKSAQ